uniref:Argonaute family member n=1 Tax=Physcomitrium patens TaxID=3218 RepID=A0A7I4BJB0_PHYPA
MPGWRGGHASRGGWDPCIQRRGRHVVVAEVYLPPPNARPWPHPCVRNRPSTVVAPRLFPPQANEEPAQAIAVTKLRPLDPLDRDTDPLRQASVAAIDVASRESAGWCPSSPSPPAPTPSASESAAGDALLLPMARPREKAHSGRAEIIVVNHFKVKDTFKFGNIHAKRMTVVPPASVDLHRKILEVLKVRMKETFGSIPLLVYDGRDSLYSNMAFPFGTLCERYTPLPSLKQQPPHYDVKLEPRGPFLGNLLQKYIEGDDMLSLHEEYINALRVIMQEHQRNSSRVVQSGPYAYYPDASYTTPVNKFLNSCTGFFKSLRPTKQGLVLNVDVAQCWFFTKDLISKTILDYVLEMMARDRQLVPNKQAELSPQQRDFCLNLLVGTKVILDYYPGEVVRKSKVEGLSHSATSKLTFMKQPENVDNVRVTDYFKEKYAKEVQWKNLPCLILKSTNGKVYVPMELAKLSPMSRFVGQGIERGKKFDFHNYLRNPGARCKRIGDMMEERYSVDINRHISDPFCAAFELGFQTSMTEVQSRVLRAPIIQFKDGQEPVDPGRVGFWAWNHKQALQGSRICWWGVCDLTGGKFTKRTEWIHFITSRATEMGIKLLKPMTTGRAHVCHLESLNTTFALIQNAIPQGEKDRGAFCQLILVIVDGHRSPLYNEIKYFGDIEKGVPVQVVNYYPLQQSYLDDKCFNKTAATNLLLKVNVKCGGRNFRLHQTLDHVSNLSSIRNRTCIFLGADVSHPGVGDHEAPSIAAVVGSIDWPDSVRFIARHSAQKRYTEIILNLQELVLDLLREWHQANRHCLPQVIILFRDGVGQSQFQEVLEKEVNAVKDAARQAAVELSSMSSYEPCITFAMVQKRHHTRLFRRICDRKYTKGLSNTPSTALSGCRDLNVPPGTVVDDKIVHPRNFDFYLCSHSGEKGTSRPAHYHILYDGTGFSADDFQNLTNKLCYMFGRSTRAVSIVTPAYYAHLAAWRARVWYQAMRQKRSSSISVGGGGGGEGGVGGIRSHDSYYSVVPPSVHPRLRLHMYYL